MRLQNFVGMRAFGDDCYRAVVPLLCQRCAVRETVPPRFGVPVFLFKYAEPLFVNLVGLPAVTASLSRELAAILKECLERALDNRSGDLCGNFQVRGELFCPDNQRAHLLTTCPAASCCMLVAPLYIAADSGLQR